MEEEESEDGGEIMNSGYELDFMVFIVDFISVT